MPLAEAEGAPALRRTGLSKSRLTLFEQCPKRLWLSVYRPELAEVTPTSVAAMATGHAVGAAACALHSDGYMIEGKDGLGAALRETAALVAAGFDRPLFEATFAHDDVLVRVDLLLPGAAGWQVIEVKGTSGVRPYHLADLATQLWVLRGSGMPVTAAAIRHLDTQFVLASHGDYRGLFADVDLQATVAPLVAGRGAVVAGARATLGGGEPTHAPGAHCDVPFACSFKTYCHRDAPAPPRWPTALLPDAAGKAVARAWAGKGVDDLTQLPADALPSERLRRIHAATLSRRSPRSDRRGRDPLHSWASACWRPAACRAIKTARRSNCASRRTASSARTYRLHRCARVAARGSRERPSELV